MLLRSMHSRRCIALMATDLAQPGDIKYLDNKRLRTEEPKKRWNKSYNDGRKTEARAGDRTPRIRIDYQTFPIPSTWGYTYFATDSRENMMEKSSILFGFARVYTYRYPCVSLSLDTIVLARRIATNAIAGLSVFSFFLNTVRNN